MEIDAYGRRFYHRGGLTAEPMDKKWLMKVDVDEARRMREDFGPIPQRPPQTSKEKVKTLDDVWKEIEVEMLCDFEPPNREVVQEGMDKSNASHWIVCERIQDTANVEMVKFDGTRHTYQIVGSWNG